MIPRKSYWLQNCNENLKIWKNCFDVSRLLQTRHVREYAPAKTVESKLAYKNILDCEDLDWGCKCQLSVKSLGYLSVVS